ncbi:MAG: hypothetical protein OXJ53_18970, partial [Gammaproteobacteria bacterium]|nr:hypothetical protein [Gammaproteobacteria bacterium]
MKGTIGSLLLVTFVLATGAAAQTNSIFFASAELGVGHDPASHGIPDNQEISFASAWQSVHEGVGIASVTVTLSVPPPLSTVYGLTVGGTATRGVDYEFICNTLMRCDSRFHDSHYYFGFQKGQTAITIPVAIFADDVADSGETIELNLETESTTIHSIGTHTLTIVDGDGDGDNPVSTTKSISFASASQSVYEASSTANVTVNLHPSPETDLTFAYTAYGTAKPDSDYTIDNSGTLLVPAGAPTATIPVVIIDDSVEDSGETVVLTLFADNGYAVGANGTHTLTILNHDPKAVWRLPPASHPSQQGFVRVINRSAAAGEVAVTATDDAGREHEPLALRLEAHAAAHFSSGDLENGNAAKGLSGGTGPGMGGWRLEFGGGALDVEARGYVRSADGFLAAMHETAPRGADGAWRLLTFNPASNADQVSRLRLVNPTDAEAWATVTGVDDSGASPGAPVVLTLPAGATCEVDAAALESGRGLACGEPQAGLGDGAGKWRLSVASEAPLAAMGLLSSPGGHLSNLSGTLAADADGAVRVPLFPPASDPHGRQGFVRVANRSGRAGLVTIRAFDESSFRYAPLRLRLEAREARQVNSDDLELGNRGKGLTGRTGAGAGAWRLELSSLDIDFEAGAYVRHRDGFLT